MNDTFKAQCQSVIDLISSFPDNKLKWEHALNEDGSWRFFAFEFAVKGQSEIPPKPADWDDSYGYDSGYARGVMTPHSADYNNGFGAHLTWSDENFSSLYHIDLVLLMVKHIYYGTQSYYEMKALRRKITDDWEAKNITYDI
jgi:hypothetical protein